MVIRFCPSVRGDSAVECNAIGSDFGFCCLPPAILSALLPFLFIELLPLEKNIVTVLKEHAWDSPQLMQPLNRMWWEHLGLVILNLFMTMLATWQYDAFVVGEQAEKWNKPKAE